MPFFNACDKLLKRPKKFKNIVEYIRRLEKALAESE
jgi:hypothetical protein